jgi:hypothetical protein
LSCQILAASWSPNEESFIVGSEDGKLSQLNTEFDVIMEVDMDDADMTQKGSKIDEATISWRGDSKFFVVNYHIEGGYKCITRDSRLKIIKGPARADDKEGAGNLVLSVSEKPIQSKKFF